VKVNSRSDYFLVFVPLLLIGFSLFRIWNALPTIMQDEYVYLVQARHEAFSENQFTNYLFSGVMRATTLCGTEFYSCTKIINSLLFTVGVVFVFLIAIRFLSFYWAIFAASVTAVSPLALQMSFFMPETMYFAFMTVVIWLALRAATSPTWVNWTLLGLMLGLTALVKPHALFILPALVMFGLIIELRTYSTKLSKRIISAGLIVLGFLASKLSIGYALAGSAGLSFFGGYGSPTSVVEAVINKSSTTQSSIIDADAELKSSLDIFLELFPIHLASHVGFTLMIAGIPLMFAFRYAWESIIKRQVVDQIPAYFILVFLLAGTLLLIVPAFEAYVTISGDDHTDRLILRYYEFLIPQFLIMGLLLPNFSIPKLRTRLIQGSIIIIGVIWFTETYSRFFGSKFADSSSLPGIAKTSSFLLFAIFVSLSVAYWVERPKRATYFMGYVLTPIVFIAALVLSQDTLLERRGNTTVIEDAGWASRDVLTNVPGQDIMVVGRHRPNVFAVKFWIDKPNIKDLLIIEGGTISKVDIDSAKYIIFVGEYQMADPHTELISGAGFKLLRME